MSLIHFGKYLIVIIFLSILNLGCSTSKKSELALNGKSVEFIIDKLGKPTNSQEFILTKKLYEYQYGLLTYFQEPEGKNIHIKELVWEIKNKKTIVWFSIVDNNWKSLDNLSWNPNLIKY